MRGPGFAFVEGKDVRSIYTMLKVVWLARYNEIQKTPLSLFSSYRQYKEKEGQATTVLQRDHSNKQRSLE